MPLETGTAKRYTFGITKGDTVSKTLSLKLDDGIFADAEKILSKADMSRNAYFNAAIGYYNHLMQRKELKARLAAESGLVKEESMNVYRVFEDADIADEA